ncbi:MAG: hypothetical protein AAFV53_35595 [Myxococcota bacterium]
MSKPSRRELLERFAASTFGLTVRSAVTGLPASFLLTGKASASDFTPRTTILACSGAGESVNCNGPGTFDPDATDWFSHAGPKVDYEQAPQFVNGVELVPGDLEIGVETTFGAETHTVAKAWATLPADLRAHLVWFNYRSGAGIHPQFPTVLRAHGGLRGALGRGSEELPAAIAQDTAALMGCITPDPIVLGGNGFSSNGSPLASYTPTQLKALVGSLGQSVGGLDNFAMLHDYFIDQSYQHIRDNGSAQQMRFLREHANSREDAAAFGYALGDLLTHIESDREIDQLRAALAIAKLNIAPVVITKYAFSGDNHGDATLVDETEDTFRMLAAIDAYWSEMKAMGLQDQVWLATADVFGRDTFLKNGRGHHGKLTTGLMLGTQLNGGVIGGHELAEKNAVFATSINATTGSPDSPDIDADDTLNAYYKTVMMAAGVPAEQRETRFPYSKEVTSHMA